MDAPRSNFNPLLAALNVKKSDRLVSVRESGAADANFVHSHLLRQILDDESNRLCLVILHNTIGHYQNVCKRLDLNLLKRIQEGLVCTVEPLKALVEEIGDENGSLYNGDLCRVLFREIKNGVDNLLTKTNGNVYLLIDDLSHLLDLGVGLNVSVNFINYCVNMDERVKFVFGSHVSSKTDLILSNALSYLSDVVINVSPLLTGRSFDVTGVISVERGGNKDIYHYKALDKEVRTFRRGESIRYLLR